MVRHKSVIPPQSISYTLSFVFLVIFSDYFSCILGLVRYGSTWSLNPFGEIRKADHSTFERGKGNSCSVEFNLLYRWHATVSEEDEDWTTKMSKGIFGDKSPDEITREDFKTAFTKMHALENDPEHWTLGGFVGYLFSLCPGTDKIWQN